MRERHFLFLRYGAQQNTDTQDMNREGELDRNYSRSQERESIRVFTQVRVLDYGDITKPCIYVELGRTCVNSVFLLSTFLYIRFVCQNVSDKYACDAYSLQIVYLTEVYIRIHFFISF